MVGCPCASGGGGCNCKTTPPVLIVVEQFTIQISFLNLCFYEKNKINKILVYLDICNLVEGCGEVLYHMVAQWLDVLNLGKKRYLCPQSRTVSSLHLLNLKKNFIEILEIRGHTTTAYFRRTFIIQLKRMHYLKKPWALFKI